MLFVRKELTLFSEKGLNVFKVEQNTTEQQKLTAVCFNNCPVVVAANRGRQSLGGIMPGYSDLKLDAAKSSRSFVVLVNFD